MSRGVLAALALGLWAGAAAGQVPAPRSAQREEDPLTAAARRAAGAWQRHDFTALVAGSPGILVRLGGAEPSSPLAAAQAARTLRAFAGGAEEIRTEVTAVREVEAGRAYAELLRTYREKGTSARRVQTLYLEWRRAGRAHRLVAIRLVP